MDKLAFVKTIEAILAAVVALSVYGFIQDYNINQVQSIERSPSRELNDFLKVIELNEIIEEYDYLKLDYLFNNLFYETIYHYFEPVYYEKFSVNASEYATYPNISFIYHFPKGVDENSVRVVSEDYELNTRASFDWYRVPIRFNESIFDQFIEVNATLEGTDINNNSLMFFVGEKESLMSITKWVDNASPPHANVTFIGYLPEIETNELSYLYFMTGGFENHTYPSLNASDDVVSFTFNQERSPTAEVIFSPESINEGINNYYLKYSLFSEETEDYDYFDSVNNSAFSVDLPNNELKSGTIPYTATIKGDKSVTRLIPLSDGYCELRVYGGYS